MAKKDRIEYLTEECDYSIRIAHWEQQLSSVEKQKKMAELLQQEGLQLLQKLKGLDTEEIGKLLQIANNSINIGINIENNCNQIKTDLLLFKPEDDRT